MRVPVWMVFKAMNLEEVSRGLRVDRGEGLNAGALLLSEVRKKRRNQQHRLRRTRK